MEDKLEKIPGIGKTTADRMRSAGIKSIEQLANMKLDDLLKVKGIGKATAEKYLKSAKEYLGKIKKETKIKEEKKPKETKEKIHEEKEKRTEKEGKTKEVKPKKPQRTEKISVKDIKALIKAQANCNIGLVGHVDHGIF